MITSSTLEAIAGDLTSMAERIETQAVSVGTAHRRVDDELALGAYAWRGPRADAILGPATTYATELAAFPGAAESAAVTVRRWAAAASTFAIEVARSEATIVQLLSDGEIWGDEVRTTQLETASSAIDEAHGNWRLACVQYCAEILPAVSKLDSLGSLRAFPTTTLPSWLPPEMLGVPLPSNPADVARWWASLSWQEQVAVLDAFPGALGNLDGVPASIRDSANRVSLTTEWQRLTSKSQTGFLTPAEIQELRNIARTAQILAGREQHVDPITGEPVTVQLYAFDPGAFDGDGLMAISMGDLDTAQHTAVSVPGLGTSIQDAGGGGIANLYDESRWATLRENNDPIAPNEDPLSDSVAIVEWVGYDAPSAPVGLDLLDPAKYLDVAGVTGMDAARAGAARLASDVEGLRAMRPDARTHMTVWGNSYGSTTTAIAATEFDLAADDVVLTASPGSGTASSVHDFSTGREHTWVGTASTDLVGTLGSDGENQSFIDADGQLGIDPANEAFGATRFEAEQPDRGVVTNPGDHSHYDNPGKEAAYNTSAVIAGRYEKVTMAPPRTEASAAEILPSDPEYQRQPEHRTHEPG